MTTPNDYTPGVTPCSCGDNRYDKWEVVDALRSVLRENDGLRAQLAALDGRIIPADMDMDWVKEGEWDHDGENVLVNMYGAGKWRDESYVWTRIAEGTGPDLAAAITDALENDHE